MTKESSDIWMSKESKDPSECSHEPKLIIRNTELVIIMRMCECGQYKHRVRPVRES